MRGSPPVEDPTSLCVPRAQVKVEQVEDRCQLLVTSLGMLLECPYCPGPSLSPRTVPNPLHHSWVPDLPPQTHGYISVPSPQHG